MAHKQHIRAALVLQAGVAFAFVLLAGWLVYLQVWRHAELRARALQNTQREYWQAPRRGDILDANGHILATSVMKCTIAADPSLIGGCRSQVARALAPLLQMNESEIIQKLTPRITLQPDGTWTTNGLQYVRLARNLPQETWLRVQSVMTNLNVGVDEKKLSRSERAFLRNLRNKSVFAEADQRRVYPNGSLAGQVVGFSGIEETNVHGRLVSKIVGRDGVEYQMQGCLIGAEGWRLTEIDRAQREQVSLRDEFVQVRDGNNVVLTIDSVVQNIVEKALAEAMQKHSPKGVTGVVMRPRTGEILAMASLPNYDPNQPKTITAEARNRVITDVVEPGSTFKIVVAAAALNAGIARLSDCFFCENGHFAFAGRILHDHDPYGNLTVREILMKSSNIGAAKIGIKIGEVALHQAAQNFGFGQRTGIPLPGEARGLFHPVKQWTKVSIAQIPMGHGIATTRLQMLYAMAAIANQGNLMRPMIIKQLQDREGRTLQRYEPTTVRRVISETACRDMVEALKTVVTKSGTAPDAALKNYIVAGKTGTAQKVENGTYVHGKYISSFIGFFPADNPELCISVVIDEAREGGYYGGKICGPVFKKIAEDCASYLNIPPDPNLMTNAPASTLANARSNARPH